MARRVIVVMMILLLSPVAAQTIREQVMLIPPGSEVVVRLKTKEKIRGQIRSVGERGFEVRGTAVEYDAVKRIDVVKARTTAQRFGRACGWLWVTATAAGLALIVVAVASGK